MVAALGLYRQCLPGPWARVLPEVVGGQCVAAVDLPGTPMLPVLFSETVAVQHRITVDGSAAASK